MNRFYFHRVERLDTGKSTTCNCSPGILTPPSDILLFPNGKVWVYVYDLRFPIGWSSPMPLNLDQLGGCNWQVIQGIPFPTIANTCVFFGRGNSRALSLELCLISVVSSPSPRMCRQQPFFVLVPVPKLRIFYCILVGCRGCWMCNSAIYTAEAKMPYATRKWHIKKNRTNSSFIAKTYVGIIGKVWEILWFS